MIIVRSSLIIRTVPDEAVNHVERLRERRNVVIGLLSEKKFDRFPNPHARESLLALRRALRSEQEPLTEALIAGLEALLDATTDDVSRGLGLNEQ